MLVKQVPGRVGDAAVPGGGAYASPNGGCASTGDGDVHLRFQPCLLVRGQLQFCHIHMPMLYSLPLSCVGMLLRT